MAIETIERAKLSPPDKPDWRSENLQDVVREVMRPVVVEPDAVPKPTREDIVRKRKERTDADKRNHRIAGRIAVLLQTYKSL